MSDAELSPPPPHVNTAGVMFPWLSWRNSAILVFIFACALLLPRLGSPEIVDADEGQRAVPPLEMLRSGNYIVPTLNSEPYLKKPPLLYWAIAPLYKTLGVKELSARLPTALSGIALALLVLYWCRQLSNPWIALVAGLICAGNALVILKARKAQLDTPMALFTCCALYYWWRGLQQRAAGAHGWREFLLGGLSLSLANLLKFPVPFGFVLPAWLGAAITLRDRRLVLAPAAWVAALLSLIPLAAWAAAVVNQLGWQQATAVWKHEVHMHYATASAINSGPVYFYVVRILGCFVPWILSLYFVFRGTALRTYVPERLTRAFLLWGCFGSLVILSIVPAKETFYMLALVPTLSILLAVGSAAFASRFSPKTRLIMLVAVCLVYLAGTHAFLVPQHVHSNQKESLKHLAAEARRRLAAGERIGEVSMESQPAVFYNIGKPLQNVSGKEVEEYLSKPGSSLVMLRKKAATYTTATIVSAGGPSKRIVLVTATEPQRATPRP